MTEDFNLRSFIAGLLVALTVSGVFVAIIWLGSRP